MFIETIAAHLVSLIDNDQFDVDNYMALHSSISCAVPATVSPLVNIEEGTPLMNILLERTMQTWSCHLQESNVLTRMQQPSENTEYQSLDEQGLLHFFSIYCTQEYWSDFAAANVEVYDVQPESPFESGEGIVDIPHLSSKPTLWNQFRKKYSIAEAWSKGKIAKYHRKLSGRRSHNFKFLILVLETGFHPVWYIRHEK